MINWKVRFKNKTFWVAIIPAVILLIQAVGAVFGITINLADVSAKLIAVVEAVFVVLAILGIVADPTTTGVTDSALAMSYTKPNAEK